MDFLRHMFNREPQPAVEDLVPPESTFDPPESAAVSITLETLRGFIRVGGVPSFERWIALPEDVQNALISEAELLRIEQAVRIGTCAHGPAAAAEILAAVDGGELSRRLALRDAAARIVAAEVAAQKGVGK